ncbi:hypothetical protein WMY93_031877 [Mugilogobius chulae]|uniref:Rhodanese domain-containing protein n=1 Tax=Mugilogobius chulae TaxID=88201 RepID=A0AAW0MHA4_9GOBI
MEVFRSSLLLLLLLHLHTSDGVRCFSQFVPSSLSCEGDIGEVDKDACCLNHKSGYRTEDGECHSCSSPTWSNWSEWSQCTTLCGRGRRWSQWSPWSPCSVSCGEGGVMKRTRKCSERPECALACTGATEETKECEVTTCPMVPPGNGCLGDGVQTQPCSELPHCAVDGGWGSWSDLGPAPCRVGWGSSSASDHVTSPPLSMEDATVRARAPGAPSARAPVQCPASGRAGLSGPTAPGHVHLMEEWLHTGPGTESALTQAEVTRVRGPLRRRAPVLVSATARCTVRGVLVLLLSLSGHLWAGCSGVHPLLRQPCPQTRWPGLPRRQQTLPDVQHQPVLSSGWSVVGVVVLGPCLEVFDPTYNLRCEPTGGSQSRERICLHRALGGAACPAGPLSETRVCYDVSGCYVKGQWAGWEPWSQCIPPCGDRSKRSRKTKCQPDFKNYSPTIGRKDEPATFLGSRWWTVGLRPLERDRTVSTPRPASDVIAPPRIHAR